MKKSIRVKSMISMLLCLCILLVGCSEKKEQSVDENVEIIANGTEGSQVIQKKDEAMVVNQEKEVSTEVVNIEEHVIEVIEIQDAVYIDRDGQVDTLLEDMVLYEGDIIITDKQGSAIIGLSSERKIYIEANTILLLKENSVLSDSERMILVLKHGKVVSEVKDSIDDKSSFELMTPSMITSIRGTVAHASHDLNTNNSIVSYYEGYGLVGDVESENTTAIVLGQSIEVHDGVFDYEILTREVIERQSEVYSKKNASTIENCIEFVSENGSELEKASLLHQEVYTCIHIRLISIQN